VRSVAAALIVVAAVAGVASADAGVARADEPVRLVLVSPPEPLEAAVRAALKPWRVVIIVERPTAPVDAATTNGLVLRHHANAIAWIEKGQLVVVDRDGEVTRRPAKKIDDASAAALALTVKTMLRLPANPPPPLPEEPPPPPTTITVRVPVPVVVRPPPPPWRLELVTGGRVRLDQASEVRVTAIGERAIGPISAVVLAAAGPGLRNDEHQERRFSGSWSDLVVGAGARLPLWPFHPDVRVAPGAGLSLHVTHLDGSFRSGNMDVLVDSGYVPSVGIDGEVGMSWTIGPASFGGRLAATYFPVRQEYTTQKRPQQDEQVVYTTAHLEAELGVLLAISF